VFSDKPSPPQNVRATEVYKDYIVIAWDVPESDGGAPITQYTLEKRDAKRTTFSKCGEVKVSEERKLKVAKLVEGNEYIFQVNAENEVGVSEWAATEAIKARLPFGEYHASMHKACPQHASPQFTIGTHFISSVHN
jgi:hypothetical protein